MHRKKNIDNALLVIVFLMIGFVIGGLIASMRTPGKTTQAIKKSSETLTNLYEKEGKLFYKENGKNFTDGLKEVIDENGQTLLYYFGKNGEAFTQGIKKLTIDGKDERYYFKEDGSAFTNGYKKVTQDGKSSYYYFSKDGKALTNSLKTVTLKGKKCIFYFGNTGKAFTGGLKEITKDGKTSLYYFKKNGQAVKSALKTVKDKDQTFTYYFTKSGKALTSSLKTIESADGTRRYYFQKSGKALTSSFKTVKGKTYYFGKNGYALTGYKKIRGNTYYFSRKTGVMFTGSHTIKDNYCIFDSEGRLVRKIDTTKKLVCLTYDDGPSRYTETILDVLEKNHAAATFFLVGDRVQTYSSTVRRADSLCCQLGNHTYDHKALTKLTNAEIGLELAKTNELINKLIGKTPTVMRPPYGCLNSQVRNQIRVPIIMWNVDTRDWKTRNVQTTIKNIKKNVSDGSIILMHDLYSETAKASKSIIPWLTQNGYELVTIDEMAAIRGGLKNGKTIYSFK